MFKNLRSIIGPLGISEAVEWKKRRHPGKLAGLPKHGLSETQVYPVGNNFVESLRAGTLRQIASFSLSEGAKVVSLGTCFAEEVSSHLSRSSIPFDYMVLEDNVWNFSANWGRVYTLANLAQIFAYTFENKPVLIEKMDGKFIDPFRESATVNFVSEYLAKETIQKHRIQSKKALQNADLVTITLGQNEAWFDSLMDCFWGSKPSGSLITKQPDRFHPVKFSFNESVDMLRSTLRQLKSKNPSVKIIITISPVPAYATFSGSNVIANSFADKCLLRTVAEQVVDEHKDFCFYFPSFEVALCDNSAVFRADNRHIKRKRIRTIFNLLDDTFLKRRQTSK